MAFLHPAAKQALHSDKTLKEGVSHLRLSFRAELKKLGYNFFNSDPESMSAVIIVTKDSGLKPVLNRTT
ncbi:hypothetical protein QUF72_08535 [Desulfobacterales bacterium HSG2]|nr:hypothetical protein [Desulfobacterales bacterium HSG2]